MIYKWLANKILFSTKLILMLCKLYRASREWMNGWMVCVGHSPRAPSSSRSSSNTLVRSFCSPRAAWIASFHGTMDTIETSAFIIIIVVGCAVCRNVRPKWQFAIWNSLLTLAGAADTTRLHNYLLYRTWAWSILFAMVAMVGVSLCASENSPALVVYLYDVQRLVLF